MNFIEADKFITAHLVNFIKEYKSAVDKMTFVESTNVKFLGGRLQRAIQEDNSKLKELKFYESILALYKAKTQRVVTELMKVLQQPIRKGDTETIKVVSKVKEKLSAQYIDLVRRYVPYEIFEKINSHTSVSCGVCDVCGNSSEFIKDGDAIICKVCFNEVVRMVFNNCSYSATGAGKCNYDRLTHFKECVKQYQCKQNTFINPKVYVDIDRALCMARIADPKVAAPDRYTKVNKHHIIYFLKELGYSKYYDDYNLIYCTLTGNRPNDISQLESVLCEDFVKISEAYATINTDKERKNFINIQFILYKLLIRHSVKINDDDFVSVKSQDKKMEREKICKAIFDHLNWKYV